MVRDFPAKSRTIKLGEDNIDKIMDDLGSGNSISDTTPK